MTFTQDKSRNANVKKMGQRSEGGGNKINKMEHAQTMYDIHALITCLEMPR
jgi:hypothetical protein